MVELNEYECLVDGFEILRIIAKHSKFFEVHVGRRRPTNSQPTQTRQQRYPNDSLHSGKLFSAVTVFVLQALFRKFLRPENSVFSRPYLSKGRAIGKSCRPSVRPSVRLSVMDVLWLSCRSWGKLFTRIIKTVC